MNDGSEDIIESVKYRYPGMEVTARIAPDWDVVEDCYEVVIVGGFGNLVDYSGDITGLMGQLVSRAVGRRTRERRRRRLVGKDERESELGEVVSELRPIVAVRAVRAHQPSSARDTHRWWAIASPRSPFHLHSGKPKRLM